MIGTLWRRSPLLAVGLAIVVGTSEFALPNSRAGEPLFRRPPPRYVATRAVGTEPVRLPGAVNSYGSLGSFYPTPDLMVRGNAPAGGGYSPLGSFGNTTLSLYGPLSSLRMTSAPVMTYSRGYDGRTVVTPGTSFSTPNLPALTPVVYPTQGSYYYGFRQSGTPPWWANGINWLDQN
ncbi:MAG: hypothetical protein U0794_14005 [Isosphaeraceae bacterium]